MTLEVFNQTHESLMQDSEFSKFVLAAQSGRLTNSLKAATISKAKTLELLAV